MRPWSEATALLAFAPPCAPDRPRLTYRRPRMDMRFALIRDLDDRAQPVIGCTDLTALARAIERTRQGRPLELVQRDDFEFANDNRLHTVVEVYTQDFGGGRGQRLCVAWLNEGGRERLEPALRRVRSDRPRAEPRRAA